MTVQMMSYPSSILKLSTTPQWQLNGWQWFNCKLVRTLISSRNIFFEINLKFRKKEKYHHKVVSASSVGRHSYDNCSFYGPWYR